MRLEGSWNKHTVTSNDSENEVGRVDEVGDGLGGGGEPGRPPTYSRGGRGAVPAMFAVRTHVLHNGTVKELADLPLTEVSHGEMLVSYSETNTVG